jgi:hypothetical protein
MGNVPPPQFSKNGEEIFEFLKSVENIIGFLRYLHLAFISSHCPWSRATFQYKTYLWDT